MITLKNTILFMFGVFWSCCSPAFAESISVGISGIDIKSFSSNIIQHINPILVKVKNTTIKLDTRRQFNTTTKSIFLQGSAKKFPVAASIVSGELRISFPGKVKGSRKSRQRLYTIHTPAKNGIMTARLSSVPASVFAHKTCATKHEPNNTHSHEKVIPSIKEGMPDTMAHVATIHTYADPEWVAQYGERSNDAILEIINEAEAIYDRQLKIRFRVVGQTVLYDMTAETNPGRLLGELTKNVNAQDPNADIKYLFTGKDLQGTTIGIAFLSAFCFQSAYGLSQPYFGGGYLFAHEVGHIFGAPHDPDSFGIMYPSILLGENREFSEISLNQINQYLSVYGSCLSIEPLPPNLTTARLTIARHRRTVSGTLTSTRNVQIPDIKIVLNINNKKVVVKTKADGSYKYTIPKSRKRTYFIYATTEKQETQSDTVWGRF